MKVKIETIRGTVYEFQVRQTIEDMNKTVDSADATSGFYRMDTGKKLLVIPLRNIESITYEVD